MFKKLSAILLLLAFMSAPVQAATWCDQSTGNCATVDNNNAHVTLPSTISQSGYAKIVGSESQPIATLHNGVTKISMETQDFYDPVDGAAINTNLWNQSASTMTITQASGFINVNATANTGASTYAIISSIQQFSLFTEQFTELVWYMKSSLMNLTNTTIEVGYGSVATTAAPTDGVFWRVANGEMRAVLNNGGTETTYLAAAASGTPMPLPSTNTVYRCTISVHFDHAVFKVRDLASEQDVVNVEVKTQTGMSSTVSLNRQPAFARVYNAGSAPASSGTLSIAGIEVHYTNANWNRPQSHVLVGYARGAYQSPVTTYGQTANHANSTSPASATLSNTAAGYTTLGGRYQFAAPAGAVTDFALFGYQVPAGYQLIIRGVTISTTNTGAAVATTATILDWGLGINSSAVSLATADGAGTWAPRRVPLSTVGFGIGALVGASGPDIVRLFDPPLIVDSGRFFHVIVQVPVGTATASQIIRGDVFVNGYFE